MDFTLSPEIEDIRLRVRAFVEEHVLPLEADPANFTEHENIPACAAGAGARESQEGRPVGAAGAQGIRRHGAADRGLGGDLRGGGALDLRPARDPLHGAGRRQHEPLGARRHARAEGQMAQADRRRQGALGLRHDRAASRLRLRSRHDADARREEGRPLHRQGAQMVHHRRRGRRAFHPDGAHVGRAAPRSDRVPLSQGSARLAHPAPHPDHGAARARRPLRDRI